MRKLFSEEYLATKSCSLMEKEHHDAIIGILLIYFVIFKISRFYWV